MRISKRGSVFVEAAIVIPILVLIIAGLIRVSFTLMDRVKQGSEEILQQNRQMQENENLTTEDILRGKWLVR